MTGPLVQNATVRTNRTKDSVHPIPVRAITFAELWSGYVTGNPFKPDPTDKADYSNQCALRLSATFHRLGIEMKSFSQKTVRPMPGAKVLGRVLMNGRPAATRAYELGEWLKLQPFAGLPPQPEDVTGKDWETQVKARTGIIMFHGYWARRGEERGEAGGGHRRVRGPQRGCLAPLDCQPMALVLRCVYRGHDHLLLFPLHAMSDPFHRPGPVRGTWPASSAN